VYGFLAVFFPNIFKIVDRIVFQIPSKLVEWFYTTEKEIAQKSKLMLKISGIIAMFIALIFIGLYFEGK
jgi:hypothetical protein